ncbi:MAG: response regulator [Spirochaetales bacterium]|nr:response regulator [Spirochaetales bacterium]
MNENSKTKIVLLIEDNKGDARLLEEMLYEAGEASFKLLCADRLETGLKYLKRGGIHLVLLDLGLPDSEGFGTFKKIYNSVPNIPIIVMTGMDDEKMAVDAVREGAQDYLVKGQVDGNLLFRAMRYAIERKKLEIEREKMILELQDALAKIKTLRGLLPICSFCKKIRDDQGYWRQIEVYMKEHSDANFSHSICPQCAKKYYPHLYKEKEGKTTDEE